MCPGVLMRTNSLMTRCRCHSAMTPPPRSGDARPTFAGRLNICWYATFTSQRQRQACRRYWASQYHHAPPVKWDPERRHVVAFSPSPATLSHLTGLGSGCGITVWHVVARWWVIAALSRGREGHRGWRAELPHQHPTRRAGVCNKTGRLVHNLAVAASQCVNEPSKSTAAAAQTLRR